MLCDCERKGDEQRGFKTAVEAESRSHMKQIAEAKEKLWKNRI